MGFHRPSSGIAGVSEDATPQLGGDLDCQTFDVENVTEVYFGDRSTNGTFRLSIVGGNLEIAKRDSGTYQTVTDFAL